MSNVIDFTTGEIIPEPEENLVMDALMSAINLFAKTYGSNETDVPLKIELLY